jgi:cytochrome c553
MLTRTIFRMTATLALVSMTGLAAGPALAAGGDAELGRGKSTTCHACHGADGLGTAPMYPKLAGQHEAYLVYALRGYRSGERKNAIMAGFATGLSDADIADLAAFYSSLDGLTTPSWE